ncbi:MAG: type IX secretion system sortase PorU [Candidatus Eisenbacteria bacterium]
MGVIGRAIRLAAPPALLLVGALPLLAGVDVVDEGEWGVLLRFTLPDLLSETAGEEGEMLRAPGFSLPAAAGVPAVPILHFALGLPPGATVSAELIAPRIEKTTEYAVAPVPSLDREGKATFLRDEARFAGVFPEEWVKISAPGRMRDQEVVSVAIQPVRYDGRSGVTEILRSGEIRIRFEGARRAPAIPAAPDAFESVYRKALLNHRTASAWRERRGTPRKATAADSFASSDNWVKLEIEERGFYAVGYDDLVAAGLLDPRSSIGDARTIRLFSGSGLPLPEEETKPRPEWMTELAIRVTGEEDGAFDPGDRIEFFGLPVEGWAGEFVPDRAVYYEHVAHPYAWRNAYWITWGGSFEGTPNRMASVDAGPAASGPDPSTPATFYDRHHEEQNLIRDLTRVGDDGWFWDKYSPSENDKSFYVKIADADTSLPGDLTVRFFHYEDPLNSCGTEVVRVKINTGGQSGPHRWDSCQRACDSTFIDDNGREVCIGPHITHHDYLSEEDTSMTVKLVEGLYAAGGWNLVNMVAANRQKVYLSWIEIGYRRFFRALDGELPFRLTGPGDYRVPVSGLAPSASRFFDVTDPFGVRELTGAASSGDSSVVWVSPGGARTYYALADSAWKTPASIGTYSPANLRDPSNAAEYLLVVYDEFQNAVLPLLGHRSRDYSTKIVKISDIWNEFSWGVRDGVALRDYLSYAYHQWPAESRPVFVLVVGDATSDFKGTQATAPLKTLIPTLFRVDPGGNETNTYATDDFFAYLDPFEGSRDWAPDIAVGRFPVNSAAEANVMARKVVAYESDPELGPWRSRFLFLADDEIKRGGTGGYDCTFLLSHTDDTEAVAGFVPEAYTPEKVYMVEYPLTSTFLKPLAKADYLGRMSEGYLLSTYFGHGGFDKMADEEVLVISDVKPETVNNGRRQHIFSAFSCSIGSWDLQEQNSIAEILIKMQNGGAIASFSSDAPAFSSVSRELGTAFFENLFDSSHEVLPIGLAAVAAKVESGASRGGRKINDEKYTILGDPALMLGVPELDVRLQQGGEISFQRGRADTLYGEVLDGSGAVASWFDGEAEVAVFGMADTLGYSFLDSACVGSANPKVRKSKYALNGPTFFRGTVDVSGGSFVAPFFVPRDTRVGDLGRAGVYLLDSGASRDGSGGDDSVRVIAEPPGTSWDDVEGPAVRFTVNGALVRSGMSFDKNALFHVELEDESGINLQQNDDFFSIHLVFDRGRPIDLTPLFRYDRNSFQKGSFSFKLSDLTGVFLHEGSHELAFRAADNLNNRTELDFQVFIVNEAGALAFRSPVLNYPNPFDPDADGETVILVDLTSPARVTIRILTLTGKRIREIETSTMERGLSIRYPWDGRDQDGDDVANGVYLVRVVAESDDGSARVEEIGKTVILRGGG